MGRRQSPAVLVESRAGEVGGLPALGYDAQDRKLVVNEQLYKNAL
jgi:hypothetical protein